MDLETTVHKNLRRLSPEEQKAVVLPSPEEIERAFQEGYDQGHGKPKYGLRIGSNQFYR